MKARWLFRVLGIPVLVFSICFLGMAGCGGQSSVRVGQLNSAIEDELPSESSLHLDAPGRIGLVQEFSGEFADSKSQKCETVARLLRVALLDGKTKKTVPIERLCDDQNQKLIFLSTVLEAGDYSLKVRGNGTGLTRLRKNQLVKQLKVIVEYSDPNFAAGVAQFPSGAKALEKNAVIPGVVDASKGIKTNWYQVVGEGGSTHLTYIADGTVPSLKVSVYHMTENLKPGRLLGVLHPKKQEKFELNNTLLFVQVEAPLFSGEIKYTLFRKDAAGGGTSAGTPALLSQVSFPLLERYLLSANSAVFVVKANEKLKPNSELTVFGKRAGQKAKELGKCNVTSIADGQGSCKMEGVDISGVTQLKFALAL